jgi:hypothetical protein
LSNALRGFDDLRVALTHAREQLPHGRVVLVGAVQLEETRSAQEAGCKDAIALEIVNRALNHAEIFVQERRHLARIRALEDAEQLQDALARARTEQPF